MDFKNLLKKSIRLLRAKIKLVNMVKVEKKSQGIEDFVKKCNFKARICSISNLFILLPSILVYQPLNFLTAISNQISDMDC